ncbi:hypothetical protein LINPERHAP1_LOCUS41446 [Linum perenne]
MDHRRYLPMAFRL